ncbi:hypothetical protein AB1E18_007855 [Capra hircus]
MPAPASRVGEKKGSPDAQRLTRSLPMRQRADSTRAPPCPRFGRLLRNGSRRRRRRVVFRAPPFPPPLSPPPQGPSQADPLRSRAYLPLAWFGFFSLEAPPLAFRVFSAAVCQEPVRFSLRLSPESRQSEAERPKGCRTLRPRGP